MRRINVLLLDKQDKIVREYQRENNCGLDEAINQIILQFKTKSKQGGKK